MIRGGSLPRRLARRILPGGLRRRLRGVARELPHRLRDAGPDLLDRWSGGPPLPPARLRRRVGRSSSRREFVAVGRRAASDVVDALAATGLAPPSGRRWLDLGCGCGRIARELVRIVPDLELTGVDVDGDGVAWCRDHLAGAFRRIDPTPPTPFAGGSFDLVLAVSLFSHFGPDAEAAWLAEVARLLVPGGVFLASTHGEDLVWERPDLSPGSIAQLAAEGYAFAPGTGAFNEASAFHGRSRLAARWGDRFELLMHRAHGLAGYQDLSLWRRRRP